MVFYFGGKFYEKVGFFSKIGLTNDGNSQNIVLIWIEFRMAEKLC